MDRPQPVHPGQGGHTPDLKKHYIPPAKCRSDSKTTTLSNRLTREKREQKAEAKWQEEVDREAASSLFPEFVRERAAEEREQKRGRKR